MSTKTRPSYALWRPYPPFDPAVFVSDLQRIAGFYQDHGYYQVRVSHDLELDGDAGWVTANILIVEGHPVRVSRLSIEIVDQPEFAAEVEKLAARLPLRTGGVFTVDDYQQTEAELKDFFFDKGRGLVEVQRKAQVLLEEGEARVFYTVTAGPKTTFATTAIEGLKSVEERVVQNELAYQTGDPFSGAALKQTERNLRELDLFSVVRIESQPPAIPGMIPMKITVEEKPPREILVGLGYGTEEQLRGQLRWSHKNWLGGARRLEAGVKASFIAREVDVTFVQPHFPDRESRLLLNFGPKQFDEPGYFLNATRLQSRWERKFSDQLTAFIAHRVEYDLLSRVSGATERELNDFASEGLLSGLSAGVLWNPVDDPLNPTRGWGLSFFAEQVGGFLGGRFDFYKLVGEARAYYPLAARAVLASRLQIGFADPFAGGKEVPIFERFYAGGGTSVRGYGRSRLGPLSTSDDPLGGRSLIEGSVELRRQFTATFGGALFIDYGQVSLRSFDLPVDRLRFSGGFGVRYLTPVGPLRFDVGFPFRRPPGDAPWQIHFSIGQSF